MDDGGRDAKGERTHLALGSWSFAVVMLLIGLLIGRSGGAEPAIAAQPDLMTTATRTAELLELHALQTAAAQPCDPTATPSPVPSPTPSPTLVPPAAMGTTLTYGPLSITATSIGPVAAPEGFTPQGQLLELTMSVANTVDQPEFLPVDSLRLIDAAGMAHKVDTDATWAVTLSGWSLPLDGLTTEDRAFVFDVPLDAGTSFVLQSVDDPTFRVALTIEARG